MVLGRLVNKERVCHVAFKGTAAIKPCPSTSVSNQMAAER